MSIKTNTQHILNTEITNLLKNIANEHGLQNYNITEASGSIKGDGYLGVITSLELSGEGDSERKVVNVVVKSAIKGDAVRSQVPIAEAYQQEIYMYNTIIPYMQKFLTEKGLPPLPSFAKCYASSAVANYETLILENLKVGGFKLWERSKPMDEDHVSLVMKEYGRFHGLSLAMRDQNPLQFEKFTKDITQNVKKYIDETGFVASVVKEGKKLAETFDLNKDSETVKVFKTFIDTAPEFFENALKSCDDYCAILHGDCWTNNIMFKYDDMVNTKTPTQLRFIDFQITMVAPPVLDLSFFFYSCSPSSILDNFEHYLHVYYSSLSNYIKKLGSNPEKVYPFTVFRQQWKDLAKFGLLISINVIKIMLSEENEIMDYSNFTESGNSMADVFSYTISKSNEYNERMKALVLHFIQNKLL